MFPIKALKLEKYYPYFPILTAVPVKKIRRPAAGDFFRASLAERLVGRLRDDVVRAALDDADGGN